MPRDERFGLGYEWIEGVRPLLAGDLKQVAKSGGRQEPGDGAFALEQRIGHYGGAEPDEGDFGAPTAGERENLSDSGERREIRALGSRQELVPPHEPFMLIDQKQVGRGSADVDADPVTLRHESFSEARHRW
jgi:hypothetical protein